MTMAPAFALPNLPALGQTDPMSADPLPPENPPVILATRRSRLALCQTEMVRDHLAGAFPDQYFRLQEMLTTGDRQQGWSLPETGGKGLFTGELERALLAGEADLAVHSAKDLPTSMPEGLALAGFLPREVVHDVLVLREGVATPTTMATGSPRRRAQMARLRPALTFCELRGNVETRLRKIAGGDADCTILAAAGLRRLGITQWPGLVFRPLSLEEMIPAVGQGAIAVQCRASEVQRWAGLFDAETARAVTIERRFLSLLGGGCHTAFAAHFDGKSLWCSGEGKESLCLPWDPAPEESLDATLRRLVPFLAET